ncbi:YebC/PmpR family DNA-binding transcriptional regulator [Rubinisphaera sp.]|uniref:YebC/PmpR family DNA-binding transcriptional regulator n=1 Tax=Rubinisphaera sp. TaxID=2024857 RepID=UPI000C0CA860|nr:YebC/PmpR family DNA-binding transcriptional regulator [Rubinisphaera sp.]MBV09349.1 YebC/PmpR family DNA-binding transcriptional regulator [Rubinisphaera sp.]|tara:strand:+ start:240 stop:962 length:723 start_codon:yes stop_codon:yes gene_type:complete
MGRSFENRKHSIAKTAAQKSKLYSRYGKMLYVVAKNGVPEPESNPALKNMIEKAKKEQVPSHVIEKAMEKARGAGGEDYSEAKYEGFGPGGCSVIVDCLTDNPTRTFTDVRNCFNKGGAKLGNTGTVAHSFDHLAVLSFKGEDADQILETLLEADVNVDDVESEEGQLTVFAAATDFYNAKQALLEMQPDLEFDVQEIAFVGQSDVELSTEDAEAFEKFLDLLNECDDVQNVYHNAKFPD